VFPAFATWVYTAKVKTVPYQYRQEMHDDCARQTSGPLRDYRPVGAGGMGDVYRAKDTRLDRIVAIKVLPDHAASQVESRDDSNARHERLPGLNHPHICILYDVGHQDDTEFLVMEYIEGETLAHRLLKGAFAAGNRSCNTQSKSPMRWIRRIAWVSHTAI